MATGVSYSNLDSLTLNSGESYTGCTFLNIGVLNLQGNTLASCILTDVGSISSTSATITFKGGSFIRATLNVTSILSIYGTPTFTDFSILGGTTRIYTSGVTFQGGTFRSACSPQTTGSTTFNNMAITSPFVQGTSGMFLTFNSCSVNCSMGSYVILNNCTAEKELTIAGDEYHIIGGVFQQIYADIRTSCEFLPTSVRTTCITPATANSSKFQYCDNFLNNWGLPTLGTGNTILDLKGYDFPKRNQTFPMNNFSNPSNVVFPPSSGIFAYGKVYGCNFNKTRGSMYFGDNSSSKDTWVKGCVAENIKIYNTSGYISLLPGNSFFGSILYFPLYGADSNSFREALISNSQSGYAYKDCDFRGARIQGSLANCTFTNCQMDGVSYECDTTGMTQVNCTTGSYTSGRNLLDPKWLTLSGLPLTRTLAPGESLAFSYAYDEDNKVPFYISGITTTPKVYLLNKYQASKLSRGASTVGNGVLPKSLTSKDLLAGSIISQDGASFSPGSLGVLKGTYYALVQNTSSSSVSARVSRSVDLSGFISWGGTGISSSVSTVANGYSGWSLNLTSTGNYVHTNLTTHTAWIFTGVNVPYIANYFINGVGGASLTDSVLDTYSNAKITTGLFGKLYEMGGDGIHYIVLKNTTGATVGSTLRDTLVTPANSWSIDSNTLLYYNFNGVRDAEVTVPDLSGKGRTLVMAGSYPAVLRTFDGMSLINSWGDTTGMSAEIGTSSFQVDAIFHLTGTSQSGGINTIFFEEHIGDITNGYFWRHNWDWYWQSCVAGTGGSLCVIPYRTGGGTFKLTLNFDNTTHNINYFINDSLVATLAVPGGSINWGSGSRFGIGKIMAGGNGYLPGYVKELCVRRIPAEGEFPFQVDSNTLMAYDFTAATNGVSSITDLSVYGRNLSVMSQTSLNGWSQSSGTASTASISSDGWALSGGIYGVCDTDLTSTFSTSSITFEVTMKFITLGGADTSLISLLGELGSNFGFELGRGSTDLVRTVFKTGSWYQALSGSITTNTWYKIKGTFDRNDNSTSIYVNGVLIQKTIGSSGITFHSSSRVTVGRRAYQWTGNDGTLNAVIKYLSVSKVVR